MKAHYCTINGCGPEEFETDFQAARRAVRDLETLYGPNIRPEVEYGRWARTSPRPTRAPRPAAGRSAASRPPPPTTPRQLLTFAQKTALREAFDKAHAPIFIGSICLKNHRAAVRYLQSLTPAAQKLALDLLLR